MSARARLLFAILLVALAAHCARPASRYTRPSISLPCVEAARDLPSPWQFGSAEPFFPWVPAAFDNSPHFTARADALGLTGDYENLRHRYVLATLSRCVRNPDFPALRTNCEIVAEARDRMRESASDARAETRSGLRVENYPYYTSVEDNFFGMCDGVALEAVSADSTHTCRVWLADETGNFGVDILVPAATFDEIHEVVNKVRFLMQTRFAPCAIR